MSISSFIRVLFIFVFIMFFLQRLFFISGVGMWLLIVPAVVFIGCTVIYLQLYRSMTVEQQKKSIRMLTNAGCIFILSMIILSIAGMLFPYRGRFENREYARLILNFVNLTTIPLFCLFIFLSTLGAKVTKFKSKQYNISFLRLYRFLLVAAAFFIGGAIYVLLQITTCTFGLTACL